MELEAVPYLSKSYLGVDKNGKRNQTISGRNNP